MKYSIYFLLAIATLFQACKKKDNSNIGGHKALISKIITSSSTVPGTFDTAYITYNADSTINYISRMSSGSVNDQHYYYSANLIRVVFGDNSSGYAEVNSIILGVNGLPITRYVLFDAYPLYSTTDYYTYNSAGELIQTLHSNPNMTGVPNDTITHVWANGDLVSQTSTSGEFDATYSFNTDQLCKAGDALYLSHLTNTGLTTNPNDHLCIGIDMGTTSAATITYTYDSQNRITSTTAYQAGQSNGTTYFEYLP